MIVKSIGVPGLGLALLAGCQGGAHHRFSADEQAEALRRFAAPEADWLLTGLTYSLIHTAAPWSKEVVDEIESGFQAVHASTRGEPERLARRGGVGAYLASLGRGLRHDDPVVRAHAMMALGIAGDRELAPELLRILAEAKHGGASQPPADDEPDAEPDAKPDAKPDDEPDDDPARASPTVAAAMALGFLGERHHAGALAALLDSPSRPTRGAAATALGFLRASEHAAAVARLLDDEEVAGAAVYSLARMGVSSYAPRIAARMGKAPATETMDYAYALARLEARDQIPAIASFLGDSHEGRTAAKALSLLGAREHADAMERLLASASPESRRDGLLALGILGDRARAPAVASLLADPDVRVRQAAAAALLLLGASEHRSAVLAALDRQRPELSRYDFDPVVVDRIAALDERLQREYRQWRRPASP